jgi:hypothetical protein
VSKNRVRAVLLKHSRTLPSHLFWFFGPVLEGEGDEEDGSQFLSGGGETRRMQLVDQFKDTSLPSLPFLKMLDGDIAI